MVSAFLAQEVKPDVDGELACPGVQVELLVEGDVVLDELLAAEGEEVQAGFDLLPLGDELGGEHPLDHLHDEVNVVLEDAA